MQQVNEKSVVLQTLVQAIKSRRCLTVRYHDQGGERIVEPHAVYTDERGELILDAYQVGGYSSSDRTPPFWRPMRIKKIKSLSQLKEVFMPRAEEGFSPSRLKYRNGLLAIVEAPSAAFGVELLKSGEEVGPPRPPAMRRN